MIRWALPLCAVLILGACGDGGDADVPVAGAYPEQETEGYHTKQTRAGVPVWELWGDRAESYSGDNKMLLQGVRMNFYQQGERQAVLTAESAEVDQVTEFTTARGNVIVVNEDGRKLESEVLHWDPEKQLIQTDEFVKVTDADQILTGYGLETDPQLTNVRIFSQVEGELPTSQASAEGEGR